MAINTSSPLYDLKMHIWKKMRDCYAGSETIKMSDDIAMRPTDEKSTAIHQNYRYLPPTAGMVMDGMLPGNEGWRAYQAYKLRAVFHDFVKEAVKSYVGLLHQKPAVFELPPEMEPLIDKATDKGESLQQLLRRINEEQLITGRVGLLADLPENPNQASPLPYITVYKAETITNWDDSDDYEDVNRLQLVILNETSFERMANYVWKWLEKYRVLEMFNPTLEDETIEGLQNINANGQDPVTAGEDDAVEVTGDPNSVASLEQINEEEQIEATQYRSGVFYLKDSATADPEKFITPMVRAKALNFIPFVFINSNDTVSMPDNPPLEGLADICLTMYRGEADYRQNLYMQGQDTLVVKGGLLTTATPDEAVRVGAGQRINLDLHGDAKYIGVNHAGLSEQRTALENDKKQASEVAGKLIAPAAGKQESGDALSTRMAAQTATLNSIALSGAAGLKKSLQQIAMWIGADPAKVNVTPNLEFADFLLDGKSMVDFMTARIMGLPLSKESLHGIMVDRGLTAFTFEEEMAKRNAEDAAEVALNIKLGLNPDGSVIQAPKPLKGDTLGSANGAPQSPPTPPPQATA